MLRFPILPLALLPGLAAAQFSLAPASSDTPEPPAVLRSEAAAIAPGQPFTVSVEVPHPDGWHTYYRNSGGVELPPALEWTLPSGFAMGPIQWPVPEVFDGLLGKSIGYHEPVSLLVELTPPGDLAAGTAVTLGVHATWQYCQTGKCINREADLELELPVADEASRDPAQAAHFDAARERLPASPAGWSFSTTRQGGDLSLRFTPPPDTTVGAARFIPDASYVAPQDEALEPARDGDEFVLPLARARDLADEWIPIGESLAGLLVLPGSGAIEVPSMPVRESPAAPPAAQPASSGDFLLVLGGMLFGGLILNLMPCVFPVIGLKIMGFVQQSGEDRRKVVAHGLAFTAGVLASFWILAGVLFMLRTTLGEKVQWGYQLQQPWFVLGLALLMFVLGLAMYGVFEIGVGATGVGGKLQSKQGPTGSFFTGVLATVVATPCSAPILGPAIAAAVALPAFQFFLAFTFMALGLSLPYLLLSAFPKLVGALPRPGPWMESFKQAMSFLLFGTAGYLLWVYSGQVGRDHMLDVFLGLTMVAVAAWIYGRWDTPARRSGVRWTARALAVGFAVFGVLACRPPQPSSLVWEKWSAEKVESLLAEGRPVFVDFTAQWCATCQLNKRRAYSEEVVELMQQRGVVALKADKTNPDPAIDARLEELGRSAIPVNVLWVPGQEPVITPELLSADYLLGLFRDQLPE